MNISRRRFMTIVSTIVMAFSLALPAYAAPRVDTIPQSESATVYPHGVPPQLLAHINIQRAAVIEAPLTERADITAVAQSRADRLAFDKKLSYNNSTTGEWGEIAVRIHAAPATPEDMYTALTATVHDRDVLFNPHATRIGFGIAVSNGETYLVVNTDNSAIEDFDQPEALLGRIQVLDPPVIF